MIKPVTWVRKVAWSSEWKEPTAQEAVLTRSITMPADEAASKSVASDDRNLQIWKGPALSALNVSGRRLLLDARQFSHQVFT